MILEWIYGVIILTVLMYLIYPLFSKSSTKTGAALELTGHIANVTSYLAKEAGDKLKSTAIEMEFRKILVGELDASAYSYGKSIHVHVNFRFKSFMKGELSSDEISELINKANKHDQVTKFKIINSQEFFKACEKFKIAVVYIFGSMIYAYNDPKMIKESKTIGIYRVGEEGLELVEPVPERNRKAKKIQIKLKDLPEVDF